LDEVSHLYSRPVDACECAIADALHEVLSAILRAILREIDLDGPIRIGQTGRGLVCACSHTGKTLVLENLENWVEGSYNQEDRCSNSENPRPSSIHKLHRYRIETPAHHRSADCDDPVRFFRVTTHQQLL
jgi:hypothetical protein